MVTTHPRRRSLVPPLLLLGPLGLLAACGGGDPAPAPPTSVAPTIAAQPTNQVVTAPAPATFSVTAAGTPAPGHQWQLSTDGGASYVDVVGATASSYTTPATAVTHSGRRYRVVVSNGAGSATSAAATLTVNAAPAAFSALSSSLVVGRANHAATLLESGQVLITGGFGLAASPAPALASAELYDPVAGTFTTLAATPRVARTNHTSTRLPDGQVLLAGGQTDNDGDGTTSAELFDPVAGTFTALAATMASPRGGHAATLLPDGTVLLSGGFNGAPGTLLSDAELYDPTTKTFTALSARMATVRDQHEATLLPGGLVLLSGGIDNNVLLDTAELYDPVAKTFTAVAARMSTIRAGHRATLLPGGQVLVTGGFDTFGATTVNALDTAEMFDPVAGTFAPLTASMVAARAVHTATLLQDGSVLLTGGATAASGTPPFAVLQSAERYGP